jgi:hypothetical protein
VDKGVRRVLLLISTFVLFVTKIHYKCLLVNYYKSLLHSLQIVQKFVISSSYSLQNLLLPDPLQIAITFTTNLLLHLTKVCYQSVTSSLQMGCYTLQKVHYHSITFITNSLLPDHYQLPLRSLQIFCYTLQKFVTSPLHSLQTCCYQTIISRNYIHYKYFVTPYKRFVTSSLQTCCYWTIISRNYTDILLPLTKGSLQVHYIHCKLILTGSIQVAITFTTNRLLHLTKVHYQSITLITKSLLPVYYKSPLHSLQTHCY